MALFFFSPMRIFYRADDEVYLGGVFTMSYEEAKRIRLEKMKKIFQLYSEGEREKAKEAT